MDSTLLGFNFFCTQPVPFYQHLCETLLSNLNSSKNKASDLTISLNNGYLKSGQYRYQIQAKGSQADLEILADKIAHDFLLSVHLIKANIVQLENQQGVTEVEPTESKGWFKKKGSPKSSLPLYQQNRVDYCHICTPLFGDNQSPQFGQLDLECACCHGEQAYLEGDDPITSALSKDQLSTFAQTLLKEKTVSIEALGLQLSTESPFLDEQHVTSSVEKGALQLRPQILVCNPNALNHYFKTSNEQVVTLSCFEKPALTLTTVNVFETKADNLALLHNQPRCDVRFAYNRAVIVLTELLRQKGIDWVYYRTNSPIPLMSFINGQWIYLNQPHPISFATPHEPLHDDDLIQKKRSNDGYKTYSYQSKSHKVKSNKDSRQDQIDVERITLNDDGVKIRDQGIHALLAQQYTPALPPQKDMAVLFFSSNYPSQIITSNSLNESKRITKDKAERTISFPHFPATGDKIIQQMRSSVTSPIKGNLLTPTNIVDKFQHAFPEHYQALSQIKLGEHRDNLQALLVVVAAILGQYQAPVINELTTQTELEAEIANQRANQQAIDRLLAHTETFLAEHSPRIDFPKHTVPKLSLSELALTKEPVQTRFEDMVCFDWCQTFKSLMSFCLAESSQLTDEQQKNSDYVARLGFGFLDSLADEITKWMDAANDRVGIKHVALAGVDFQYTAFTKRLVRRLSVNYTIQANWQLDLEGANLAVGALYVPKRRGFRG